MEKENATPANNTGLPKRTAPGGGYSFYSEADADLTTTKGRVEWFCAHFEIEPPALEYDETDSLLLTQNLIEWTRQEGVSLDWLVCGAVAGALAVYREKYKRTAEELRFIEALEHFTESEKQIVSDAIRRGIKPGADFETEIKSTMDQIKAAREAV
jgi:hypothetical protein